jgi:uncharacterized protein YfiM (DUF2279 family)
MIPFSSFSPDIDPTTPGVITDCENLIPTLRGYAGAPSGVSVGMSALAAAALGAALPGQAVAVERDKLLHFAGSAVLTAVTYAITEDTKIAIAVGLGAGLAKEIYDSRRGGTGFSKPDLGADVLGVAAGMGLMFTFNYGF